MNTLLFTLLALLSVQATLTTDPVKPGRSLISSNILGNFVVESINCDEPTDEITFKIEEKSLSFAGCNSVNGPYTYDRDTKQWKVTVFRSTRIYCLIDQDSLITQALQNAEVAFRIGEFVIFMDKQGVVTLRLRQVVSCAPGNSDIQGNYQVITADGTKLTANITLNINDKSVGFRGCNIGSGSYKYDVATRSWSVGPIIQTLRACRPEDQDELVVKSLNEAKIVYRLGQFIIFDKSMGKQLMRAKLIRPTSTTSSQSPNLSLIPALGSP